MFTDYALHIERNRYSSNNYAIFEQIAIEEFIKRVDDKELQKAIRHFADSPDPNKRKGGLIIVGGKKVRISFIADPSEPGSYIAKFAYVDNPNAAGDLAELIYIAVRGMGTDEDAVYAVAAAYRQYCQDLGKDEVKEMQKVAQEYQKKYGVALNESLWGDFDDTLDRDAFDNYLMRGLYLQGNPGDVGKDFAARVIDYTKPDFAARMLSSDVSHSNSIRFLLSCPLRYLRPIDAAFQKENGESILEKMKTQGVSSDVRDLVATYFMGAGLIKKSSEFEYAAKVAVEGPAKSEPGYTISGGAGAVAL